MGDWTDKYKVNVPEGKSGDWAVEHFTVSEEQAKLEMMRSLFSSNRGRGVPAGTYTRLTRRGHTIMSDTPDEIRDHLDPIRAARGHVLINGLGLGMVLQAVLRKPEVERATVVDNSADVIALVGPHYQTMFGDRLTIIQANALEYKPPKGVRFGAVWHDIWDDLCGDNLTQMHTLHRRYGRRTEWQGSWGRGWIEARR